MVLPWFTHQEIANDGEAPCTCVILRKNSGMKQWKHRLQVSLNSIGKVLIYFSIKHVSSHEHKMFIYNVVKATATVAVLASGSFHFSPVNTDSLFCFPTNRLKYKRHRLPWSHDTQWPYIAGLWQLAPKSHNQDTTPILDSLAVWQWVQVRDFSDPCAIKCEAWEVAVTFIILRPWMVRWD